MNARVSSRAPADGRRRQRKNKKKAATAEPPLTGPASIHDVPLDLLKLILLRLDSSLWLIRASLVCKLWRGVITSGDGNGDFLLLSRALHPPAIAGYYHLGSDPTAFVPTSVPSALDVRLSSLNFLPIGKTRWKVADSHGGLVLLLQPASYYPDLIVCDPLTRRHQGIIHPRRLIYSAAGCYLLDGGGGGVSMSNFRVLYMFHDINSGQPKAWVFSTAEGGDWRLLETMGKDLGSFAGARLVGRLDDGSLCMGLRSGRVMVLDNASLEFSQLDLPDNGKELPLPGHQYYYGAACPYTLPWPPLLQACVGQSRRRRQHAVMYQS